MAIHPFPHFLTKPPPFCLTPSLSSKDFQIPPPPQFPSILEKLNPPYEVVTENHTFYQNNE